MKNRPVIVAIALTLTSVLAFSLWKFVQWKRLTSRLSGVSISDLPPFQYYALIVILAATLMTVIWLVLQIVPKRQARALYKPASPIVIGERKITIEGFAHSSPSAIKPTELFSIENEARKTLSQIIGGFVVIVGLLISGASFITTTRLTQEGQITDRFTKAIAQLGDEDHLQVRLGGIYALERIAKDSEKDHWTIMEVLTAFVRVKALKPPIKTTGKSGQATEKDHNASTKPSTDIQAVLTVIGRRKSDGEDNHLDLTNAFLREADLSGADLSRADLSGAHFEGADLSGADLIRADLRAAHFEVADLSGAHFEGADLSGANLNSANLKGANLKGANLSGANLRRDYMYTRIRVKPRPLHRESLDDAARLTWEQIAKAFIDERTELPSEITEPHKDEIKALIEQSTKALRRR